MRIVDILEKEAVAHDVRANNKEEVLRELSDLLAVRHPEIDKQELVRVLLEREKLGSTGLEDGVAIPHAKMGGLDKVLAAFGRSRQGLDFESIDGKPTHMFFLLIAPENSAGSHLKALARISKALKEDRFRKRLMEAQDAKSLYGVIAEEDETL